MNTDGSCSTTVDETGGGARLGDTGIAPPPQNRSWSLYGARFLERRRTKAALPFSRLAAVVPPTADLHRARHFGSEYSTVITRWRGVEERGSRRLPGAARRAPQALQNLAWEGFSCPQDEQLIGPHLS